MLKSNRSRAAVAVAVAVASTLAVSSTASAHGAKDHDTRGRKHVRCVITTDKRAEIKDQIAVLQGQLASHHPTKAQIAAYKSAVLELVDAARGVKLTAAQKEAKKAELAKLGQILSRVKTAEERDAIRAEIHAIRTELRGTKLTETERKDLKVKIETLRGQMLPQKLTKKEKADLKSQIATLASQLRCLTA